MKTRTYALLSVPAVLFLIALFAVLPFKVSNAQVSSSSPPIISAITASSSEDGTNATVMWVTDIPTNSEVRFGLTSSYGMSNINVIPVTEHSVALTGLTPNTLYHFQVLSANEDGTVFATSSDQTFTTANPGSEPLPAPTISSVVASSTADGTGVTISWLTDVGATTQAAIGFVAGEYIATSTFVPNLTMDHSVAFIGLTPNTLYHFQVLSANASGTLTASGNQTFTTANPGTEPSSAPVISEVFASSSTDGTEAAVSWVTDVGASSRVLFGTTSDYTASSEPDSSLLTNHFVVLTGLTPNTQYHFQVLSANASGTLATSTDQTFTTASPVVPPLPAPVISNIETSSTDDGTGVTISWLTDTGATSQVAIGLTSDYTETSTLDSDLQTVHSVVFANLTPNTLYHFQVLSANASGTLATSSDRTFTTTNPGNEPLPGPVISNIEATSNTSGTGAAITWTTDVGANSQVVFGTTSSYGATSTLDSTLVINHSVVLAGLTPNTLYHFQVLSANASGTVATSSDRTFTTTSSGGGGGTPPVVDVRGLREDIQQFRDDINVSRDQLRQRVRERVQDIREQAETLRDSLRN
ncbi:MAG: fibronectin type III domain-containing protein [Candidatus Paceibacterota bacterium]|jgi:hypothetical protein